MSKLWNWAAGALITIVAVALVLWVTDWSTPVMAIFTPKKTVEQRVAEYGPAVKSRLAGDFARAGLQYPPKKLALLAIKEEKKLEVYAGNSPADFRYIKTYPVLAMSGDVGPKLKRGDGQVPEGIYLIESLNPNSRFHLALRLNYPNPFDQQVARREKREDLGTDIMIHGKESSVGCLAMGDEAAEDLFVLAAQTGLENVRVVIAPVDFRKGRKLELSRLPWKLPWIEQLYAETTAAMDTLPIPDTVAAK